MTREPMHHDVKSWPGPFQDVWDGRKTFEVRRDDRGYAVNDSLTMHEWDPESEEYTGRKLWCRVGYKQDPTFRITEGFCVLGIFDVVLMSESDGVSPRLMGRVTTQALSDTLNTISHIQEDARARKNPDMWWMLEFGMDPLRWEYRRREKNGGHHARDFSGSDRYRAPDGVVLDGRDVDESRFIGDNLAAGEPVDAMALKASKLAGVDLRMPDGNDQVYERAAARIRAEMPVPGEGEDAVLRVDLGEGKSRRVAAKGLRVSLVTGDGTRIPLSCDDPLSEPPPSSEPVTESVKIEMKCDDIMRFWSPRECLLANIFDVRLWWCKCSYKPPFGRGDHVDCRRHGKR